ncbi:hypothetical protein HOI71_22445 [Candidatus Poribacteria bacterium]|nr:hypothetical protein [Candidatus Poribacteria bacterium]
MERVLDMRAETMATIPPSGLFVFGVTVARDPLPAAEEALLPDALAASPAPSEAAGTDDADEPEPDATPVDAPMADTLPHVTVAGIDEPDTAGPADADDLVVEAAFLDSRLDADVTPPAEAVVERLREDVDGDGIVGLADLVHVARRFGAHVTVGDLADVDGDGVVTIRDLLYVATAMQAVGAAPSRGALAGDAAKLLAGDISPEGFVRAVASSTRDADTQLLPNYPNPFNPETWIPFDLEGDGVVTLTVYDTRGSVVRRLDLGYLAGGGYRTPGRAAHWDGRTESGETAGSGTYIVALNAGGETHRRRVMLVK